MDVFDELIHLPQTRAKVALATIVQVRGSIPSFESAKLLVPRMGRWWAHRRRLRRSRSVECGPGSDRDEQAPPYVVQSRAGCRVRQRPDLRRQLDVFVECITPQPAALIFGGGHISKSLAKVLDLAGFRVSVIDDREA